MMEDSWRDASKKGVKLLAHVMCWNTLGDVISVWQRFWDELATAS